MHKRAERSLDEKAEVGGAKRECQPLRQQTRLVRQQRERVGVELAALDRMGLGRSRRLGRVRPVHS
jgi:hypothetical protein